MSAQMYDRITINGEDLNLAAAPLEEFFRRNPVKRPAFSSFNSGCMRGYVASWEVREGRLYLTGIRMVCDTESSFASIFPDAPDGVFADWVSGELRCSSGRLLEVDNAGFGGRREFETTLEVEEGVVLFAP